MYSLTFSGAYLLCRTVEPQEQQPLKGGESCGKAALICVSSPKRVHVKETVALRGPCLHSHPSPGHALHHHAHLVSTRTVHPCLPTLPHSLQVPHSLLAATSGHSHFLRPSPGSIPQASMTPPSPVESALLTAASGVFVNPPQLIALDWLSHAACGICLDTLCMPTWGTGLISVSEVSKLLPPCQAEPLPCCFRKPPSH